LSQPRAPRGVGLYLHVPFCSRKCPYCDFNTYAGLDDLHEAFVLALCSEIERRAPLIEGRKVETVFLGGGTPTALSPAQLSRILATVFRCLDVAGDAEVTSEANPGSADAARFDALRAAGVNRLSIGAQSFDPSELEFLGRIHDADATEAAVAGARSAGFENLSLDLIFGLPEQSPERWNNSLERAVALSPEHLSLYSLIVERGTPLWQWVDEGRVPPPDDDAAAGMYEAARDRLAAAGFTQYEVSNWALSEAQASRHNLVYWRNGDWLACGPGAHGQLRRMEAGSLVLRRYANVRPVPGYIRRVQEGALPTDSDELIEQRVAMGESMMLGLRLIDEGVPHARFRARHGADPRTIFAAPLEELEQWGLLRVDDKRSVLTERGLMLGNRVFEHFIAD
jgi:oxygen-independent coproporphyrinogen-3 oxidase